jgi:hypothetical protein
MRTGVPPFPIIPGNQKYGLLALATLPAYRDHNVGYFLDRGVRPGPAWRISGTEKTGIIRMAG